VLAERDEAEARGERKAWSQVGRLSDELAYVKRECDEARAREEEALQALTRCEIERDRACMHEHQLLERLNRARARYLELKEGAGE
jgi:hypothetical protein